MDRPEEEPQPSVFGSIKRVRLNNGNDYVAVHGINWRDLFREKTRWLCERRKFGV